MKKLMLLGMVSLLVNVASASEECEQFMAEKNGDTQVCDMVDFQCVQGLYPRLIKKASSSKALDLAIAICQ